MNLYNNQLYIDDINRVASLDIPWYKFQDATVLISGASGMIGSCLIDILLAKNREGLNCTIYAIGRNKQLFDERFSIYHNNNALVFIEQDVTQPISHPDICNIKYILHLASNTHPIQYATDPIGTITTNIFGLNNLLNLATTANTSRVVFASSNEIYGESRNDTEYFSETYCGYINPNTLRAGYTESKRCGESLCQAYRAQKGLDIVIPRLTRSYGPTMRLSDSKAISQFIKNGVDRRNIVLKSSGNQYFSYTYVFDAVSGLLYTLLLGIDGEAYNIADETGDITLKELAEYIASESNTQVEFKIPDLVEQSGYSTATKARLDGSKLKQLGWSPFYDIRGGVSRTIKILQECGDNG